MNVKEILINRLSLSDGEYISGAELARQIGVSRNAVWKAVKSLENDGYIIESVTSKGYRIASQSNKLSVEIIRISFTFINLRSFLYIFYYTQIIPYKHLKFKTVLYKLFKFLLTYSAK